ncbi:hypothetical protein ACVDG5_000295 [Mesorhizobium sp. ORM6]
MNDQVDPRLQRLLGGEHLASLRRRLRQRFERAPLGGAVDHMTRKSRMKRLRRNEY